MTRRVAVVGLGVLGSAAAYRLALRGADVVGYEQFELGHSRGASHDTSRIVRRTYDRSEYVQLADLAYADWRELERRTGQRLLTTTGGLTFLPSNEEHQARNYERALADCAVEAQWLDSAETASRWPAFRPPPDTHVLFQADTAIVHAARTTALFQQLALDAGAVLHDNTPVEALEPDEYGIALWINGARERFHSIVLCADAWTAPLLAPLGAKLPLESTLEQVSYFVPQDARPFRVGAFPVWIWDDEPCYYGFPTYGEETVKAARDVSGVPLDLKRRSYQPVPEREDELRSFMASFLPGSGPLVRTVTCQYTLTPDRDFLLGPVPGYPALQVAIGCGHAFKFAPTIGRVLADLAMGVPPSENIAVFDPARFTPER
jgi:sarcosine oxidase